MTVPPPGPLRSIFTIRLPTQPNSAFWPNALSQPLATACAVMVSLNSFFEMFMFGARNTLRTATHWRMLRVVKGATREMG